ncbi:hypothetical protein AA313_de0207823 [Arthrobotrys entomopaga]|nr:hypothetical protein AA313_de0207823 [Arthrobotrys entomopaga]
MLDALDECVDRQDKGLVPLILSMANPDNKHLRVIISARDSIGIATELTPSQDDTKDSPPKTPEDIKRRVEIVKITAEKNASDLEAYLTHEVRDLVKHRIRPDAHPGYHDAEVKRIVRVVHMRAQGDFSLARIIVANLQQPSKLPLEEKIKRLPGAIREMYMTALESLTDDQQESWNVMKEDDEEERDDHEEGEKPEDVDPNGVKSNEKLVSYPDMDGDEDPEVMEVIHHLETTGRDFFKYDKNTGFVGVDISIREWIQGASKAASKSQSVTKEARGFKKQKTQAGYTVFSFTLTRKPSLSAFI